MTQRSLVKWNILNAYYIPTSYLQSYNLPTYLPTNPPTYLPRCTSIYLPTYPPAYLCRCTTHPLTNPPTYLPIYHLPTYLSTHSHIYLHTTYLPTYLHINYVLTHPPAYMYYSPTCLPMHPPTQLPCPTTYLPSWLAFYNQFRFMYF